MSVFAYLTAIGPGIATPPDRSGGGGGSFDFPWEENFDEIDYSGLVAKYTDADWTWNFADPSAYIRVTGGALEMDGGGPDGPQYVRFGFPPFATPARQWWARLRFSVLGGDYDTPDDPIYFIAYNNAAGNIETDLSTFGPGNPPSPSPPLHYFEIAQYAASVAAEGAVSSTPRLLPVGDYEMIICSSEDDDTTQRAELWINAAPGDPATVVSVITKPSAAAHDTFYFGADGPAAAGTTLRILPFSVIAGPRTDDPYGIL